MAAHLNRFLPCPVIALSLPRLGSSGGGGGGGTGSQVPRTVMYMYRYSTLLGACRFGRIEKASPHPPS